MHKILIVDDNVDHLETLGAILELAGFKVIVESDPKKAVKVAEKERPEVIMSDINMPGMSGLELTRLLKSNKKTKDIIILIFSSAPQSGETFRKSLEVGADDYIRMPADKDEIISRISVCVERQRYIDELREKEEFIKTSMEGTDEGLWDWNCVSGEIVFDDNWPRVLGYEPGERDFNLEWWKEKASPEALPVFEKALNDYLAGRKKYYELEYQIKNAREEYRWVWARGIAVEKDKDGKPLRMLGTHRDITERKKAEEKIRVLAEEWQRTFDSISDMIFMLDRDNTIRRVNKVFLDAFKLKSEDVIGKKCYELVHKSDKPWAACPHAKTIKDSKPHTEEVEDPVLGIPLLVSTSPILNDKNECVGTVHIAKDITVIKDKEKELAKKMHDLEVFHKAAVDRELKMIELKKRIKELEERGSNADLKT